jgi:nucleoid-associated protein YgaU
MGWRADCSRASTLMMSGAALLLFTVTAEPAADAARTMATPTTIAPADTTVSDTVTPPTEPTDGSPETNAPSTTASSAVGAADDADDELVTLLAVFGFGLLVAVAGWWMVRRSDRDSQPPTRAVIGDGPPEDDLV